MPLYTVVTWVLDNADRLGTVAVLLFLGFCFYQGWLVPGWVYREVKQERDALRAAAEEANRELAATVREQELMLRYTAPPRRRARAPAAREEAPEG